MHAFLFTAVGRKFASCCLKSRLPRIRNCLGKKIIVAVRTTAGIIEKPLDFQMLKTTQDNAATNERVLPFLQYIVEQAVFDFTRIRNVQII